MYSVILTECYPKEKRENVVQTTSIQQSLMSVQNTGPIQTTQWNCRNENVRKIRFGQF